MPRSQATACSLLANPGVVSSALFARVFASIMALSSAGAEFSTSVANGFAFEDLEYLFPRSFTGAAGACEAA